MLGTRQIWVMFLISFVDVAVTAVIFEIPNFLYNWALDKYLQRRKNKNKNKTWQHRASLVFCEDTRFLESIFVCFVSLLLLF